jgi:hypothetical protein
VASFLLPKLLVDDAFLRQLDTLKLPEKEIAGGVVSEGGAAAYALVWEHGNVRQTKPGPKTVLGTNPDGRMVWLSIQAPFGYIRIHEADYWDAAERVLSEVNWNQSSVSAMTRELQKAMRKFGKLCAPLIEEAAPEDSGDLKDSIKAVDSTDGILYEELDEYETFALGE